jgi:hypothetical protein
MTLRFPVFAAALLAGCAGGQYAQNLTVASAAPAPDAFACVRDQIKALGFTQSSYDTDELRVTARKNNESVRRPDVQFRRLVDRLEVDVAPGTGGEVSRISVVARTLAELTTHRGPTEEEEKPSETVRAAAQAIADKCGGEMRPAADSVVPPS